MTTKMNNVDNNGRQQRVLLQWGGSILNTTISMTTNINHDDEDVTTATKTKTTMAMNEDNDEETNSKDNNDLIFWHNNFLSQHRTIPFFPVSLN